MDLTIDSITTIPLLPAATAAVSVNGVRLDPNNTVLYQNGVTNPVVYCGPCSFNVSVSLSEPQPPDGAYGLAGYLQTPCDGLVLISQTVSLAGIPFTAAPALQVQPSGFLCLGPTILWKLTDNNQQLLAEVETPFEVYFLPKPPVANFVSGIPVEFLRAFRDFSASFWKTRVIANGTPLPALGYSLSSLAQAPASPVSMDEEIAVAVLFCYQHGPRYNSVGGGAPGFFTGTSFRLLSWVGSGSQAVCSCEDQTLVLWMTLTTLFGRTVNTCFIGWVGAAGSNRFWITAQSLVGVENPTPPYPFLVNNPLYGNAASPLDQAAWVVTGAPPPAVRSGFGNHRFCMVMDANQVIADATIGPFAGQLQLQQYLTLVLDPSVSQSQPTLNPETSFATFAQYTST